MTAVAPVVSPHAGEVVLGFGAAIDREIVWDAVVLGDLARHHGIGPDDLTAVGPIRTERDLVASVLGYLARGAGGERHVESAEVIGVFCDRFDGETSLGGTCVRAASAMARSGVPATVHLSFVDDDVLALLPPGAAHLVGENDAEYHPHLIVQYPSGARVVTDRLDLVAPRANRLIYVNDPANERIALSDGLIGAVASAEVVLVSGLNALRSEVDLQPRLRHVEAALRHADADALVMYEDAGFHEPHLAEVVRRRLVPLVDVYSLSDEELAEVLGRPVDLLDADDVLAAVTEVAARLQVGALVVHSRHWALAVADDATAAAALRPALRAGVVLATARYAHGATATPTDVAGIRAALDRLAARDGGPDDVARRLQQSAGGRVVVVPVPLVDVATPTTVGLGDTFVGGFLSECARSPELRRAVSRRSGGAS